MVFLWKLKMLWLLARRINMKPFWQGFRAVCKFIVWKFEPKEVIHPYDMTYHSKRYNNDITLHEKDKTDGATWFPNIGLAWAFHDPLFERGEWDDGTPVTLEQANRTMIDIMKDEEQPKWVRKLVWKGLQSKKTKKIWDKKRKESP